MSRLPIGSLETCEFWDFGRNCFVTVKLLEPGKGNLLPSKLYEIVDILFSLLLFSVSDILDFGLLKFCRTLFESCDYGVELDDGLLCCFDVFSSSFCFWVGFVWVQIRLIFLLVLGWV